MLRTLITGFCTFTFCFLLGTMMALLLTDCGGEDGARCEIVTEDSGDVYLVCKTGHEVVYPINDQGNPVERSDGKVDYQYPDEES